MTDRPTTMMKRRLLFLTGVILIVVVYIGIKVFAASVSESEKWRELANSQQVRSTPLKASRGTIYDSTGQVLAQSATVYTVYCDQKMLWDDFISKKDEKRQELTDAIASTDDAEKKADYQARLADTKTSQQAFDDLVAFLATNLEMETSDVKDKINNDHDRYVILKREVDKAVADKIEDYLSEEELDGVRCDPTTKRFYPQNEMAANVVGHLNYDGDGIYGLEAFYDDYLAGVDGRVVTATARNGTEIPYKYKQSYDAQNGDSLYSNIDMNIRIQFTETLQDRRGQI